MGLHEQHDVGRREVQREGRDMILGDLWGSTLTVGGKPVTERGQSRR